MPSVMRAFWSCDTQCNKTGTHGTVRANHSNEGINYCYDQRLARNGQSTNVAHCSPIRLLDMPLLANPKEGESYIHRAVFLLTCATHSLIHMMLRISCSRSFMYA